MIRSIAVTTDFSHFSRRPFGAAADLARRFGAVLYIVHVVRDPEIVLPWQMAETSPEEVRVRQCTAQKRLEELATDEPSFERLDVRPRAIVGRSVSALCRFEQREGVDLLITASHGSTGAEHVLFGNFAAKAVQLTSSPVLVFRDPAVAERRSSSTFEPRRILVPHDFSHSSRTGLSVARSWAREFKASMRLLYVVDSDDYERHGPPAESPQEFFERVREEGHRQLEGLIAEEPESANDAVVRLGHPAIEILKETEEYGADLVIMASRGLSDLERLNLGSVGERTVHGVSCPVLMVKERA